MLKSCFANFNPLLQRRNDGLELLDRGLDGGAFGFLLRHLPIYGGNLGILFGGLADQEAAMHLDQVGWRILGRLELGERIVLPGQGRTQPRGVELSRHQIALRMPELGTAHGRIELDKDVVGIDALAVADMDRTHDAGLERLDGLGTAARNDLARRHGDDVDRADARPGQRDAEHGDDREGDGAADRRRGRLDDLECGRQKREFVLSTPYARLRKDYNIFSGPHAALPGADRALHIGRRS